ncbi:MULTISPECIES: MFS transporter [Amycolatopsis]|uniref:MFS transporter n=1 Tax=Amycolatopsis bullii TaxID=941987 RepID=A0ABQ3KBV2_9PSEU|nr:MFS transporter [Amycolatopsis bullii]GHG12124.1 MFS transporter [Amycolatopsis bullii]
MLTWREEVRGPLETRLACALASLYVATGLSFSALAVFMIRQQHLSPAVYGLGASVAAVLGLVAGPAIGALADRRDGFVIYAVLLGVMAIVTAGLVFAPPLAGLGLFAVLVMCARGSAAVLGSLIGTAVDRDRRLRFRAMTRAMSNTAMILGLGIGAIVLAVGSRTAFTVSFSIEAVLLATTGALVLRARRHARPGAAAPGDSAPEEEAGEPQSARDPRVVWLMVLNCVFSLAEPMLTIALPLWVSTHMQVPLWIVSVALATNTIGVVVLQVPVARSVTTVRRAAHAARAGAVLFAVAAALFPLAALASHRAGVVPALTVVVALTIALVCGDVLYSVGSTGLLYELVPQGAYGRAQGIFGMGFDVAYLAAPALFGWIAAGGGGWGWALLAVLFAIAAVPVHRISGSVSGRAALGVKAVNGERGKVPEDA